MDVRAAETGDIDPLARLWYDGWQDAHARILPADLARHRSLDSFRHRLHVALASVRVVGPYALACAIGNERAATFYAKHGWRRVGTMINRLETPDGLFPLEVWRYEKQVRPG